MKHVEQDTRVRQAIMLPRDLAHWLTTEARRNGGSRASEIIRSCRERMDREMAVSPAIKDRAA